MILVIHPHADQMHNVPMEYAHVCLSIKEILTQVVDQNVSLAMIVLVISHV
jgi:site-specific recombinase